ncbi:uncharacterized protein BCR38DRAFT_422170 [Pseudomassariella vexata]|uniref:Uncharacterized protein n=1 Tax=Pseudomassariella vexata TaxID=1141098 RepID=A0A1Y2EFV3_9PEZI|nr:uncharacterized protein BCR38DRAFT_422170 [Pseudomassariella vexata]ORY70458.1 hypothetical protein BCR38DRAFT_422170 [Pseudomassariella vexata]
MRQVRTLQKTMLREASGFDVLFVFIEFAWVSTTSIEDEVQLVTRRKAALFHPTHWGPLRSMPKVEQNIALLLVKARQRSEDLKDDASANEKSYTTCHIPLSATIRVDGGPQPAVSSQDSAALRDAEIV